MISIVKFENRHIDECVQIEKKCFSDPWSKNMITLSFSSSVSLFFAAEDDDGLIGFIMAYKVLDEIEIINIAVNEKYRKNGVGSSLLNEILKVASNEKIKNIYLEVRKSNVTAIKFYEKYGFSVYSVRKMYYNKPIEDALMMRMHLTEGDVNVPANPIKQ